jgi:hypothetical protein
MKAAQDKICIVSVPRTSHSEQRPADSIVTKGDLQPSACLSVLKVLFLAILSITQLLSASALREDGHKFCGFYQILR